MMGVCEVKRMHDCMTQEDAMNMDNKQAAQILIPLRDMMIDQHGCPISDAWFALDKAIDALSTQPNGDLISRQAAAEVIYKALKIPAPDYRKDPFHDTMSLAVAMAKEIPSAQPEQRWIPCSSGNLPQTTDPVNITWVNREPEPYYSHIKDVPFTATGHYHNGKWWWYSATCKDYLDEYGESEVDRVDDGIEILAWQPLPPAYDGEKS